MAVETQQGTSEGVIADTAVDVDVGKIKGVDAGEGWAALLIAPFEPYAFMANVVKWVTVVRNSRDHLEGMITIPGEPGAVFVSFIPEPYVFHKYIYLPMFDEKKIQQVELEAQARGYDWAVQLYRSQYGGQETEEDAQGEEDVLIPEIDEGDVDGVNN